MLYEVITIEFPYKVISTNAGTVGGNKVHLTFNDFLFAEDPDLVVYTENYENIQSTTDP